MARRKIRKVRYDDYQRWVGLQHYMLRSKAWRADLGDDGKPLWRPLSPNAKAILIDVWTRYNGANNGAISYSVREAAAIGIGKNAAAAAFRELIEHGFLRIGRASAFSLKTREAREWFITALPASDGSKPTKDFMSWSPGASRQSKTRSRARDRRSRQRDREAEDATKLASSVPPKGPSAPDRAVPRSRARDTSNYHGAYPPDIECTRTTAPTASTTPHLRVVHAADPERVLTAAERPPAAQQCQPDLQEPTMRIVATSREPALAGARCRLETEIAALDEEAIYDVFG